MMSAEERKADGSFHCASGRRNEALDCRVYALCASDAFLDGLVFSYREQAKKERLKQAEIEKIDKVWLLNEFKIMTGNEDYYKND